MAQADFSNAKIEMYNCPPTTGNSPPWSMQNIGISYNSSGTLFNSSNQIICTGNSMTQTSSQLGRRVFYFQGSFTANGTEFYIGANGSKWWRVYDISFSSGDNYGFYIEITTTIE